MANIDLMALLSTLVLAATIATTVFAIAAYILSRGYERKLRRRGPLIEPAQEPAPAEGAGGPKPAPRIG
jgi:hypothetical protein